MLPTSRSLVIAALAALAVVAGPAAAHVEIVPPMAGFLVFAGGGALGLIAVIWGVAAKIRGRRRGGAIATLLGGLAFLAVAIPAVISTTRGYPRINDITTDPADAPALSEHGDYPAELAAEASRAYPEVKPLELSLPPEAALAAALETARSLDGWHIVTVGDSGFEGYERSRLFKFRDDFAVRVRALSGGSRIDMRSASRDGKGDFGVNAARIARFLEALEAAAR